MHSSIGLGPVIGAMVLGLALSGSLANAAKVTGEAKEVNSNAVHANGNVYDQVLLGGRSATVTADPGQITRISFVDLNDDIVQVEFSGAGAMTVSLEAMSGPAAPVNYNQPDVLYMRGAATITIDGSDASTNINIFSVGRANAVNQALIRSDVDYDGMADVVLLQINANPLNPNGSTFGSIYAGNTHFSGFREKTGINAPNVHVQNLVRLHDITAFDDAVPYLQFGQNSQFGSVEVCGGNLQQPNLQPIQADGYAYSIRFLSGATTDGWIFPAAIKGEYRLFRDGMVVVVPIVSVDGVFCN